MIFRAAGPGDAPAVAGFLRARVASSMFLLGNLEAHGLFGAGHPHATRFLVARRDGGIAGVFGWTESGFLMCQAPGIDGAAAATVLRFLDGITMRGITGPEEQVATVVAALPFSAADWRLNRVEPLLRFDLAALDADGIATRAPRAGDRALLAEWYRAYLLETGGAAPAEAAAEAASRAAEAVDGGTLRLLLEDGAPAAMAAVNAQAGNAVQVGSVFVPPPLRGAGRAGRAVAGLLAHAAARGARQAVLFAASPAAARSYERIGFVRVGGYRVALLDGVRQVGGVPCP
jgi:GNAT superfamily N-acetyltransferase